MTQKKGLHHGNQTCYVTYNIIMYIMDEWIFGVYLNHYGENSIITT